jgi:hypothetical protein
VELLKTLWLAILLRKQLLTFWARGKIFDIVNRNYRHMEGYCMCGTKCDDHGFGDGHGPVDSWYYNRDQFVYGERK